MSAEKPRERPILFNDQMVRAILEGRKTVTRRVVKDTGFYAIDAAIHGNDVALREREALSTRCPYGEPGDRLWVRETWGLQVRSYGGGAGEFIVYRATNPDAIYCRSSEGREYPVKWKPSIHMHRHSSRILLEITAVRVERLQDISEEQALAEGVRGEPCDHARQACSDIGCWGDTAKGAFGFLWEQLNGAGAWQANPWVWVVEFKRVTP
ncbi:hypothetical protein CP913_24090 [Pseudomonas aeruginosa]|uniref:hypothetical protein n=1 Tax=Pseudomonas aeruginosa TaxID=287 RepID=UPI000BD17002|nr:hypothetical protein [Pseudomonas aeruginosa]AXN27821.1 hypothetical protein CP913_24090 [Pseudomonas aeruginosa]PCN00071.1 hypothetical protein CP916_01805 [Pseudomonas aeruginosa]PCN06436.1 hypothetical protein CP915_03120 [Pseudomonas aeruginosa]PCN16788.1 hypothetical protein CP914_09810 [Pseudomonas aeruginosa]UFM90843.1 hypothetical protein LO758_07545 [Pseudomonas aeruginosa]